MKILVTGANGQLGSDLCRELEKRGLSFIGMTRQDGDLTDAEAVRRFVLQHKPDAILHAAAYTNVDRAEEEPERCRAVNVDATRTLTELCRKRKSSLLLLSTDYVFSGNRDEPYEVDQQPDPINVYGQSKAEAESIVQSGLERHFIVRTSWLFGHKGKNFVRTMLRLGRTGETVSVVDDQAGSPTYTVDLACFLCDLIQTERFGIYHAANQGCVTWADFAETIFQQAELACQVKRVPSALYAARARRPKCVCFNTDKLQREGFSAFPDWLNALTRFLASE